MIFDAIVIGGGIVGASLAYHLAKAGMKTRLIDRHDVGRATDAGAGILSPQTSSSQSEDWYRFGVKSVEYYQPLIDSLMAEQEQSTGYAMCGLLRVAVSDDELEPFTQLRQRIFERQGRYGQPSQDLQDISAEQAKELFPAIADVQKAIYHGNGARVDGRQLCTALIQAGITYGLDVQAGSVERLLIQDQDVVGVSVNNEEILAGKVAIAGGAWSTSFADQLGVPIAVEPQRGQIIHLQLDNVDTADWSVIHPFRGHYIVAWEGGRVVVGATREMGSGFVPHTTAIGVRDVLNEALRVAPGLAEAQLLEVRIGLRPYSGDSLPIMGTVPDVGNVYLATGHGPTGLQLGPYSGKVIADLMAGNPVEDDLKPFHITRFMD